MSTLLSISIALLLLGLAGSIVLLIRSGEERVSFLIAFFIFLAVHQAIALWTRPDAALGNDPASVGELAGLAASAMALLVLLAVWRVAGERDHAERLHWDSMETVRLLGELAAKPTPHAGEILPTLLGIGCRRFGMEIGLLSRVDGDRYEIVAIEAPDDYGIETGAVFPLDDTLCRSTLSFHRPIAVERLSSSRWSGHPARETFGFEAYFGAAVAAGGRPLGTLCFASRRRRKRPITAAEKDLLTLMSRWLGLQLERSEPLETSRQPEVGAARAPGPAPDSTSADAAPREPRTLDANLLLHRMEKKLLRMAGPDVELRLQLAPDLALAHAPLIPLEAIVRSLTQNALDALPAGGRITLRTANLETPAGEAGEAGSYVTLSASDDRSGADAEALSRIDDSEESQEDPAEGWDPEARISLAAVQRLLRRSGGDVSVEARAGGGVTVTLFLARADAPAGN